MAERAYFFASLSLGWLLRSATYSRIRVINDNGNRKVRKRRGFHAPVLIWMGGLVARILNTGQRVLGQKDWEERERLIYQEVRGTSIQVDADGTLVLPFIEGRTLATLLEDPARDESMRKEAIESAVVALAQFHRLGFTHGDAMAENVLIDDSRVAHWLDFECVHDSRHSVVWRRADDLRSLLFTCLVRTAPEKVPEALQAILVAYGDADVAQELTTSFTSVWRRSLAFHLAQARLSFQSFQQIGRLLQAFRGGPH